LYIDNSFAKAKDYLKTKMEYVFQKEHAYLAFQKVSAVPKHVSKSFILPFGTKQDKSHFPLADQIIKT